MPFILCVHFTMDRPKETAENDLEKGLLPLAYIKSKEGFFFPFSCKVTILEIRACVLTASVCETDLQLLYSTVSIIRGDNSSLTGLRVFRGSSFQGLRHLSCRFR